MFGNRNAVQYRRHCLGKEFLKSSSRADSDHLLALGVLRWASLYSSCCEALYFPSSPELRARSPQECGTGRKEPSSLQSKAKTAEQTHRVSLWLIKNYKTLTIVLEEFLAVERLWGKLRNHNSFLCSQEGCQ